MVACFGHRRRLATTALFTWTDLHHLFTKTIQVLNLVFHNFLPQTPSIEPQLQSSLNTNHLHSTYHKIQSNLDMSSNVLADKDINASATTGAPADGAVKDVKSMEYHRQVLQSKLEEGQYVLLFLRPPRRPLSNPGPIANRSTIEESKHTSHLPTTS